MQPAKSPKTASAYAHTHGVPKRGLSDAAVVGAARTGALHGAEHILKTRLVEERVRDHDKTLDADKHLQKCAPDGIPTGALPGPK